MTARVLVGCECSGRVREALRRRGIDAWSCDTLPAEDGSQFHLQGDVLAVIEDGWDGAIFHPECTYLSNSGVQWLNPALVSTPTVAKGIDRYVAMAEAARFYRRLRDCSIPLKIIENPVMNPHAARLVQPGTRQVVQPHWFGDPFLKATGFELINVPPLVRTHFMDVPKAKTDPERHKAWSACHREPPGPDRKRNRSRTYPGVAEALADAMVRALDVNSPGRQLTPQPGTVAA